MRYPIKHIRIPNQLTTMKNQIYILMVAFLVTASMQQLAAQQQWVVSMGVAPQQTPQGHYIFANREQPKNEFTFNLNKVKSSYYLGVGTRYTIAPFFFQGEAQYNQQSYVYDVSYTYPEFVRSSEVLEYTETTHMINVPVSIGVDLKFMEFTSGFIPKFVVAHQNEMEAINGFEDDMNTVQFAWQAGLAAKLASVRLGITCQMDMKQYGSHMNVNGESLTLTGKPTRIVGTASYIF